MGSTKRKLSSSILVLCFRMKIRLPWEGSDYNIWKVIVNDFCPFEMLVANGMCLRTLVESKMKTERRLGDLNMGTSVEAVKCC